MSALQEQVAARKADRERAAERRRAAKQAHRAAMSAQEAQALKQAEAGRSERGGPRAAEELRQLRGELGSLRGDAGELRELRGELVELGELRAQAAQEAQAAQAGRAQRSAVAAKAAAAAQRPQLAGGWGQADGDGAGEWKGEGLSGLARLRAEAHELRLLHKAQEKANSLMLARHVQQKVGQPLSGLLRVRPSPAP